jgi:hypothetical protein
VSQISSLVKEVSLGRVEVGMGPNFKDGLNEGEGVGVGINFQQKIICGTNARPLIVLLSVITKRKQKRYIASVRGTESSRRGGR